MINENYSTPDPGIEEESRLYELFFRCSHILHRKLRCGISTLQALTLLYCEDYTQKELQDHLGIQAGSLSELMSKLEKMQLIERKRDLSDKRRILVSITEKGKCHLKENGGITDKALFCALNAEEQIMLRRLLEKMVCANNECERWGDNP